MIIKDKSLYTAPDFKYIKTEYDRKDAANGTLVSLALDSNLLHNTLTHIHDWLRNAPDQTNLHGVQSLDIANAMKATKTNIHSINLVICNFKFVSDKLCMF